MTETILNSSGMTKKHHGRYGMTDDITSVTGGQINIRIDKGELTYEMGK